MTEDEYKQEMMDIICRNGTNVETAECLNKYFIDTPYYIDQLKRLQNQYNMLYSPIMCHTEEDVIEVLEIEKIIKNIKLKIKKD